GDVECPPRGDGRGAPGGGDRRGWYERSARAEPDRRPRPAGRRGGDGARGPRAARRAAARRLAGGGGPAGRRGAPRGAGDGGPLRASLHDAPGRARLAGGCMSRRRVLVVGLDAATFDLMLPWAEAGHLPTVARLLREGVHAPLRSTLPALTP